MSVVMAVVKDILRYFNPRTKRGLIHLLLLCVVVFIIARFGFGGAPTEVVEDEQLAQTVVVATVGNFTEASQLELVGDVEAISQARILSEASGRVTAVNVTLGQSVGAGTVIAQLENASERAALLQAEGAYEAALASAATSDISADSAATALLNAEQAAVTTVKNSYTTISNTVFTSVDQIYADPEGALPGIRIAGGNQTNFLNSTRVELQTILPTWQASTVSLTDEDDLVSALAEARVNTSLVLTLVDAVIEQLTRDPEDYIGTEFENLRANLLGERNTLLATLSGIDNAETAIEQAEDALRQAEVGGTTSDLSAANAAVKQALGSLRSAEANFAKTIIRTPIAGVVNTLDVDTGDFISQQTPVATVANNNALEITTFVGETDRARIAVGQEVIIENTEAGVISNIAPAINPDTRKVEVQIQTESETIANGDTVNITIVSSDGEETDTTPIETILLVPLTAVKFTATDGFMFTVVDGVLVSNPVTLGPISGSFVTIENGIDVATEFVVDARGLTEGLEVEALTE